MHSSKPAFTKRESNNARHRAVISLRVHGTVFLIPIVESRRSKSVPVKLLIGASDVVNFNVNFEKFDIHDFLNVKQKAEFGKSKVCLDLSFNKKHCCLLSACTYINKHRHFINFYSSFSAISANAVFFK